MGLKPFFLGIFQKGNMISLIMARPLLPDLDCWSFATRVTASWIGIENNAKSFVVNDQLV